MPSPTWKYPVTELGDDYDDILVPDPLPMGELPEEWSVTTTPPPPGYNVIRPSMAFRDYYNLRSPKIAPEDETPELRNLRAWREANYRMPFDALGNQPEGKWWSFKSIFHEFTSGFMFGSLFGLFFHGPDFVRTMWPIVSGRSPHWKSLPLKMKLKVLNRIRRRALKIPLLFAYFQTFLRGLTPLTDLVWLPGLLGAFIYGARRIRRKISKGRRRPRWYRRWERYRSLGNVHALEWRSLILGGMREKALTWLRIPTKRFYKGAWRIALIFFWIEFLIELAHSAFGFTKMIALGNGFYSLAVKSAARFGPDPPEQAQPKIFKRPEAPEPALDGSKWYTYWLSYNNRPSSGKPYVPDERMFSVADLKPILDDTPEMNIKYDHTAIHAMDHTPAFKLGQRDWRNKNLPTGRHEPLVRVGALPDGRYIMERICLETLTQNLADHDPRWVDPALTDIAADLLKKAKADEIMLGKLTTAEIVTDTWEEEPHKPLIVKDWNRSESRKGDQLLHTNYWSIANLPIFGLLERIVAASSSNAPTYRIKDGPGGYENLPLGELARRRRYALENQHLAPARHSPLGVVPKDFLKRIMEIHAETTGIPVPSAESSSMQDSAL